MTPSYMIWEYAGPVLLFVSVIVLFLGIGIELFGDKSDGKNRRETDSVDKS